MKQALIVIDVQESFRQRPFWDESEYPAFISQIQPLIDATRQRVSSGIVADADLADAGVIFGTGFAPFTGGPLHYEDGSTQQHRSTAARAE